MDELKLATMLVARGEEVPKEVMDAAIQQLELMAMECDEHQVARKHILDRLIKALQSKDRDELLKAIDLFLDIDEPLSSDHHDHFEPTDTVVELIKDVVHDFTDMFRKQGLPSRAGFEILKQLGDKGAIPLRYRDNILVCFDQNDCEIMLISINNEMSLVEFAAIDPVDNADIFTAVMEQWQPRSNALEVSFYNLEYRMMGEDKFSLVMKSAR